MKKPLISTDQHRFTLVAAALVGLAVPGLSAAQPDPAGAQEAQGQKSPQPEKAPQDKPQDKPQAGAHRDCPTFMKNVKISTKPVEGGVELVFTAPSGQVTTLQNQLRQAATMLENHSKAGAGGEPGADPAHGASAIPPIDITMNETPTGARVIVRAERPEDVSMLRQQASDLERLWESAGCLEKQQPQKQKQTQKQPKQPPQKQQAPKQETP